MVGTARTEHCEASLPQNELNWCSVSLSDVISIGKRLEAAVFKIEGRHAREMVQNCKWGAKPFSEMISNSYYPNRFKRIYTEGSGIPFFLPSQIVEIFPQPEKFISELTECDFGELKLRKNDLLLTRSGTVGKLSLVSETLAGTVFSDDVIRVTAKEGEAGFLYAYLQSRIGNMLLTTNRYGSVIQHIEPEHLTEIIVPNPSPALKKKIHDLVMQSFDLRDQSNNLIKEATEKLAAALSLPPLEELAVKRFDNSKEVDNYNVKLSTSAQRFDASYHVSIVDAIVEHFKKNAAEVMTIGDTRISKEIILPGRFKRVYVEEGHGRVFIGGKQLFELDPSNKKYLSLVHHGSRIEKQLELQENMILITCSGTIGKVTLTPKHWEHWAANQHIIRVVPATEDMAGYLSIFLASDYGRALVTRFTYGSVVDEVDSTHIAQVQIPLLKDKQVQEEINRLALEANKLRYEAYQLEQKALKMIETDVLV